MPDSEEKPGKGRRRRARRGLLRRFKEAWDWYRDNPKPASQDEPDPEEGRKTMGILGIGFLLVLSLFAMIRGGSILSMALPLALAALIFVQDRLGWARATSAQYRRAQDWLQALILLMFLILFGSDLVAKHF